MTNIQSNNVSFGSRVVLTEPLRKIFFDSKINCFGGGRVRQNINAIESLLNDGKDDVIKISGKRYGKNIIVRVNGKKEASYAIYGKALHSLGLSVSDSIYRFARKRNKDVDLDKRLNFEYTIIQNFKKELINYTRKKENSLLDIHQYAEKLNNDAERVICGDLINILEKITKQLF